MAPEQIPQEVMDKIKEKYYMISKDNPSYEKHGEGWNEQSENNIAGATSPESARYAGENGIRWIDDIFRIRV